jgi:serine protease inhibitor
MLARFGIENLNPNFLRKDYSQSYGKSNKPREISPATSLADVISLVAGNSDFTFGLYQALKDADGNIFYSPYSITEALAMTYGGARGRTAEQMAETLHPRPYLTTAPFHRTCTNLSTVAMKSDGGVR